MRPALMWLTVVVGGLLTAVGGLWLLQGLGAVTLDPIACVGECTPIQGPDGTWALVGATVLAIGAIIAALGARSLGGRRTARTSR